MFTEATRHVYWVNQWYTIWPRCQNLTQFTINPLRRKQTEVRQGLAFRFEWFYTDDVQTSQNDAFLLFLKFTIHVSAVYQLSRTTFVHPKHNYWQMPEFEWFTNESNRQMSESWNGFFSRASYAILSRHIKKAITCSCKGNPSSILPSNCWFTVWNWLKFFNPNLINFNMILPPWVRLGFELNPKLNVLTVKEEIPRLNNLSQALAFIGRKHWPRNDI